jgi:hypothetical protein
MDTAYGTYLGILYCGVGRGRRKGFGKSINVNHPLEKYRSKQM